MKNGALLVALTLVCLIVGYTSRGSDGAAPGADATGSTADASNKVAVNSVTAAAVEPNDKAPLPAALEPQFMKVPAGFHVNLFAGEPDVVQPASLAIDDRGRLWVGEFLSYPKWKPEGHDPIVIFSEKPGEGKLDKRTVFWDQGNYLSGIELGFGGVWVCSTPKLLFIPTKPGSDEPSGPPQTLLDGWSTAGVHNTLNDLTWGPDGWLYGCNGISAPSRVGAPGTPDAERQAISCGVWRYHPTKHIFETVAHGQTNPWGLDYDDYGQIFSTNCVVAHLWHIIPGAHFKRMRGEDYNPYVYDLLDSPADHLHWGGGDWTTGRGGKGLNDVAGGGHAHAGAMVYLGDNWPDSYRGSIFMCNIHGNRLNNDLLVRHGSGYIGKHGADFMQSADHWFRGINLKYGPDGAVYVIDWCDNGECHNVAMTSKDTGRIYKVVYNSVPALPADFDLNKLSDLELVQLQGHKNDWYVRHARRILQERAAAGHDMKAVHEALHTMFTTATDAPRQLRALWALHVTNGDSPQFLVEQLRHKSEYVRGWSIQLLMEDKHPPAAALAEFARMANEDASPFVRLYLASGLQRMDAADRWPIAAGLLSHAEDADDHNLPLMDWWAIEAAVPTDPARAMELAIGSKISIVRRYIARRLATVGGPAADTIVKFLENTHDSAIQYDVLGGVYDALRGRRHEPMPGGWDAVYKRISVAAPGGVRVAADKLALIYGDAHAADALRQIMLDAKAEAARRQSALTALVEVRAPGQAAPLQQLLDDPDLRSDAVRGLAAYDDPQTPKLLLGHYAQWDAALRHDAIDTLVSRPAYALALLEAVEQKQVPSADISMFTARQLQQFKNQKINALLTKTWGALHESSGDKQQQLEHYKSILTPEFLKGADPSQGRLVFSHTCMQCHTLYGTGGKVGPDLTGSNRNNRDYVLQKLMDPSAAVPKEFQMQVIVLNDGRLISGIVREQTPRSVVVQTDRQQVILATEDIEQMKPSKVSMMPEGQLDKMTREQMRDLFGYLATHNQVPLPADAAAAK